MMSVLNWLVNLKDPFLFVQIELVETNNKLNSDITNITQEKENHLEQLNLVTLFITFQHVRYHVLGIFFSSENLKKCSKSGQLFLKKFAVVCC